MLKFENSDIFTGYIKQLLSSFNLPKARIYTEELETAGQIIGSTIDNPIIYIKDDFFQQAEEQTQTNGTKTYTWHILDTNNRYVYNKQVLNSTKNLLIKNNFYDNYTHEYLGEYLRFMRDYHKIDLMPLYNCFTNKTCTKLKISSIANFNSSDSRYKIFMLPVHLFKNYTIAIDCQDPVEVCCGLYSKNYRTIPSSIVVDNGEIFSKNTYQKFNSTKFNSPVLYSKLTDEKIFALTDGIPSQKLKKQLALNEHDLKMFIKVPVSSNSTITILEGNYTANNNRALQKSGNVFKVVKNKTIITIDNNHPEAQREFKAITPLKLLQANTQESYPFADRLREYLLENAITPLDINSDDIRRVNKVMDENGIKYMHYGAQNSMIRVAMYEFMTTAKDSHLAEADHDILGYIDKDIEKQYKSNKNSLLNVDIYEEG